MLKNILITGSSGFIGSNLREYFSEKYNVLAPRNFELNLLDEVSVEKYFGENDIDFVIHCAANGAVIASSATIQEVTDKNILMFNNLARNLNSKQYMINMGSGAEYNKNQSLSKVKESDFGRSIPADPYGYSKYVISKEIEKYENILNVRLFGVYGKNESETRFPTAALLKNLAKEPITINKNVVFDYLFIEDLCKIAEIFIQNKPKDKFINVTPTQSVSLIEIAQAVNKISDFKSEIIIKEQGLNNEYTGDNSRLLEQIKDFQFAAIENGLEKLFNHLNALQKTPV